MYKKMIVKEKEGESEGDDMGAIDGRRERVGYYVNEAHINEIQKI